MRIRLANKEDKKKKQPNTRNQKILNEAFPSDTEYVHIIFKYGVIEIIPITNKINQSITTFKKLKNPLTASIACSSGIDGYSLKENRFQIDTLIEYRSHEKRDKTDLSETDAVNALSNLNINSLINEDIMSLDLDKIAKLTAMSTSTLFMILL